MKLLLILTVLTSSLTSFAAGGVGTSWNGGKGGLTNMPNVPTAQGRQAATGNKAVALRWETANGAVDSVAGGSVFNPGPGTLNPQPQGMYYCKTDSTPATYYACVFASCRMCFRLKDVTGGSTKTE